MRSSLSENSKNTNICRTQWQVCYTLYYLLPWLTSSAITECMTWNTWLFTYLFLKYQGRHTPNASLEQNVSRLFQRSKLTRRSKSCLLENCQAISLQTRWETPWNMGKIWGFIQQARSQPSLMQEKHHCDSFNSLSQYAVVGGICSLLLTRCHKTVDKYKAKSSKVKILPAYFKGVFAPGKVRYWRRAARFAAMSLPTRCCTWWCKAGSPPQPSAAGTCQGTAEMLWLLRALLTSAA